MLQMTSSQASSIMTKKFKMADLLRFPAFYVNNFKFNNGGVLLSSVLLFYESDFYGSTDFVVLLFEYHVLTLFCSH